MMTPNPEQTGLSTQYLPITPAIQAMKSWDTEKVLRWIEQRDSNILEENDIDNFKKARIAGRGFLAYSVEDFQNFGLSLTVATALWDLAGEIRYPGKFIPRTQLRH
jgi:hypothetical protein